jgi:hypothetical protein
VNLGESWTLTNLYIYICHVYKILNCNIPCHVNRTFDDVDEYFAMWQYLKHGWNLEMDERWEVLKPFQTLHGWNLYCIAMHIHQSIWPTQFNSKVKWNNFNACDTCSCNINCPSS